MRLELQLPLVLALKATGVPIDRYSYEAIELMKDIIARWKTLRTLKESRVFQVGASGNLPAALNVPDIEVYPIDVSFEALRDRTEVEYLNDLPTSFVLSSAMARSTSPLMAWASLTFVLPPSNIAMFPIAAASQAFRLSSAPSTRTRWSQPRRPPGFMR